MAAAKPRPAGSTAPWAEEMAAARSLPWEVIASSAAGRAGLASPGAAEGQRRGRGGLGGNPVAAAVWGRPGGQILSPFATSHRAQPCGSALKPYPRKRASGSEIKQAVVQTWWARAVCGR